MEFHIALFVMLGLLLATLGAAMAVRAYRDARGINPHIPSDRHILILKRMTLAMYVLVAVGYAAIPVTESYLWDVALEAKTLH